MQCQGARSSGERGTTSLSVANLSVANRASDTHHRVNFSATPVTRKWPSGCANCVLGNICLDYGFVTFILHCNV
jgi:hypothetical protein